MGVPLYVICHFSLVAFNKFSLSLIFVNLITMCLGVFLLGFILPQTLCVSWIWVAIFFPLLGKSSTIISSNIFSGPFSLSSPSGTPIMSMLGCFVFSHKSYMLLSFFYMSFCCSDWVISIILSSRSLMHSYVSLSLLLLLECFLFQILNYLFLTGSFIFSSFLL